MSVAEELGRVLVFTVGAVACILAGLLYGALIVWAIQVKKRLLEDRRQHG